MSNNQISKCDLRSSDPRRKEDTKSSPPRPSLTPEAVEREFDPCTATASYFIYAQRNIILCLHHDTLAIERRIDVHQEDVLWIYADTISERGAGRFVVSYDAGHTAIVWDISTGQQVSRFSAYEKLCTATWLRNGQVAFGNAQGNVILFEPSTSEHISTRTIYDPITAIAPAADNRTFAVGHRNGSILIVTVQPYRILHSLSTSRPPCRISGLAWHGSTSKQKSDMLASQTVNGDLRVWNIPKVPGSESPNVIRLLGRGDWRVSGPCWFAWSKNGRIIQYLDKVTRSWDVRTKTVSSEVVPTLDGVTGIANYGPTSTLFTLGRNHTVQQFDITPGNKPMQVACAQHAPGALPPSPPTSDEEKKRKQARGNEKKAEADEKQAKAVPLTTMPTTMSIAFEVQDNDTSEGEGAVLSPLQRIAKEMDQIEEERRDRLAPLSPQSSRASSISSKSSGGNRRTPSYRYDKTLSSRASDLSLNDGTEFSYGQSAPLGRENMSIRSSSSYTPSKYRTSNLRNQLLRSPEEVQRMMQMDLFPYTKARLANVPFRAPYYGQAARTSDVLRREMLSIVFGWNDDTESLVREELSKHQSGSAGAILLSKWLGELGADTMASMIGAESMSSSDWMLLALSSMGHAPQKKIGQAFVQRLLEKSDVHPAVAVLLSLDEQNDAIEIYVSRGYFLEAVLLTCLVYPSDWQRQSFLVRKLGELAMAQGQPEIAVRCFSCTSIESSEPWFSPRAQDDAFSAQQERMTARSMTSPPLSPPSATGSGRLAVKNPTLKLITTFGDKGVALVPVSKLVTPVTNIQAAGVTPIADSALSPGDASPWVRRKDRDPSSARTATPSTYNRERFPSASEKQRSRQPSETPLTAARDFAVPPEPAEAAMHKQSASSRRSSSSVSSAKQLNPDRALSASSHMPSPAQDMFSRLRGDSLNRNGSRERMPDGLQVQVYETTYLGLAAPSRPGTSASDSAGGINGRRGGDHGHHRKGSAPTEHAKVEAWNAQIEATAPGRRSNNQSRTSNKDSRSHSRVSNQADAQERVGMRYIRLAKRSPASPVPMSPEEVLAATRAAMSSSGGSADRAAKDTSTARTIAKTDDQPTSRQRSPDPLRQMAHTRGRSQQRKTGAPERSPYSPLPMTMNRYSVSNDDVFDIDDTREKPRERGKSRGLANRSLSRLPSSPLVDLLDAHLAMAPSVLERSTPHDMESGSPLVIARDASSRRNAAGSPTVERAGRDMTKKELAAQELEARRLSLARRPSAPAIPPPGDYSPLRRPSMPPRYHTELGNSPTSFSPPMSGSSITRSHTADPDTIMRSRYRTTGTSTPSAPIGLPATPRAMRHPRYMSADPNEREFVINVPEPTETVVQLTAAVYQPERKLDSDALGPLLPSTVFGQKGPQALFRSASAPPERQQDSMPSHPAYKAALPSSSRRGSISRTNSRRVTSPDVQTSPHQQSQQGSPPIITSSIDEALHDTQVIIVEEPEVVDEPQVLPQLRHLTTPPPPPPPPVMTNFPHHSETIEVVLEEEDPIIIDVSPNLERSAPTSPSSYRQGIERSSTASPSAHRRGRGSVSETFGSRIRNVTERIRSTSRSGAKSPPTGTDAYKPAPYETVLPGMITRRESVTRVKSPYESSLSSAAASEVSILPPQSSRTPATPLIPQGELPELSRPSSRTGIAFQGYRHPKEVRAMQQGGSQSGGMI